MSKATNKGTCQCCGAVQKLPGGVLAKHGYTVSKQWNLFEGVCQGSGHLPLEKSSDLIRSFILWAAAKVVPLEEFKVKMLAPPVEGTTTAWIYLYWSGSKFLKGTSGYRWTLVDLVFNDNGGWLLTQCVHPETKKLQRVEFYGNFPSGVTPLDRIAELNKKRAAALDLDIKNLQSYIKWQQDRVDTWKDRELLPL